MPKAGFLYKQVYEKIKKNILDGEFSPGSKLPSEEEFCKEYQVSAITVKKAMDLLVADELVQRVPGWGTFAAEEVQKTEEIQMAEEKEERIEKEKDWKERKRNKLIGLVLEHVSSPFGVEMMYCIDSEARKAGYKLCIRFSYGSREKETEEIDYLLSMDVEGIIIMPCHGTHYNNAILKLIIEKFPIVLIDKKLAGIEVPSVSTDGRKAVKTLVMHLSERHCNKIGLITVDVEGTTSLIERREGFYLSMDELGLTPEKECVLPHEITDFLESKAKMEYISLLCDYFKKMKGELDGVICTEFGFMPALVQAAKECKIAIGKELKVCCIDEDYQAPGGYYFTHMKQDEKAIARLAVELLLQENRPAAKDYTVPALFHQGRTT